jgi:hypothetical protein
MRARRRRRAPLGGFVVALALALPGAAAADDAGSVTASGGPVQATLSWQAADFGVKDPRLVVVRAGATLYDGSPVGDPDLCSVGCIFAGTGADAPLKVVDLDGDGEPEVVVDAYTGGAHCCTLTEVLRFTGAAYARLETAWGSLGYNLADLDGDGRPELSGHDFAFEDAFSSHAASFEPPLVLDYDPAVKGGFRVVTRRFPALARKNAKDALHTLRAARRQHYETLGVVAAYVADLYLLGRGREVRPYLARARKRGDLRGVSGPAPRSFERKLLTFLHAQGYR